MTANGLQQRTYGAVERADGGWLIREIEPHVAIKLKAIFPRIARGDHAPFMLTGGTSLDADLLWFLQRYPMRMAAGESERLTEGRTLFETGQAQILNILSADWKPSAQIRFRDNRQPWRYQAQAAEMARSLGRLLIADDIGLGKTISALTTVAVPECLPAAVVVQAHLAEQWADYIESFTHMTTHIIKGTRPYSLPPADLYVFKYSNIFGWVDYLQRGMFRSAIFDEMQELRTGQHTAKGRAARVLIEHAGVRIGLTASPVYNYGDEIWQVVEFLEPGALGTWSEFMTEWCRDGRRVTDPKALGAHLRELNLIIRRLEDDPEVDKAMPPLNTVVHTIPYDEEVAAESEELARQLAISVTSGSFTVSGQAAREFNALMRQTTGVAKARHVAAYVRMLLDAGRKVVVAGWHRECYAIWGHELAAYNPVMYTGTESPAAKRRAKQDFISGATDLMFISLRSGTGLDGLQEVCHTAVVGELDWSPEVHKQFFGRLRRPGQKHQVDAVYLVADGGADPVMIDALGVKASQSRGIKDPFLGAETQHTDATRIKALAEAFLRGEHKMGTAPGPAVARALDAGHRQGEMFGGAA